MLEIWKSLKAKGHGAGIGHSRSWMFWLICVWYDVRFKCWPWPWSLFRRPCCPCWQIMQSPMRIFHLQLENPFHSSYKYTLIMIFEPNLKEKSYGNILKAHHHCSWVMDSLSPTSPIQLETLLSVEVVKYQRLSVLFVHYLWLSDLSMQCGMSWNWSIHSSESLLWPKCFYSLIESQKSTISTQLLPAGQHGLKLQNWCLLAKEKRWGGNQKSGEESFAEPLLTVIGSSDFWGWNRK